MKTRVINCSNSSYFDPFVENRRDKKIRNLRRNIKLRDASAIRRDTITISVNADNLIS